jgi:hypothetical protein
MLDFGKAPLRVEEIKVLTMGLQEHQHPYRNLAVHT